MAATASAEHHRASQGQLVARMEPAPPAWPKAPNHMGASKLSKVRSVRNSAEAGGQHGRNCISPTRLAVRR